ncbi:MAG TPA: alpha/beta hydrolase [Acidimicrobiia bacterium]|nr:alpha/beta hydrolase [Acidimicrobiia bacterium]
MVHLYEFVTLARKDQELLHGARTGDGNALALHIHGSWGNFYENPFVLDVAQTYLDAGFTYASVNNPGHDGGTITESFDESFAAIRDWCDQLAPEAPVILQAHSLGALKILRLATHPDFADFFERVSAVVLLSPFDLVGFYGGRNAERRRSHAKEFRDQFGGKAILPASIFDVWPISAETFLELSEPGSEYDLFPSRNHDVGALASLAIPTLVVLGGEDIASDPTAVDVMTALEAVEATSILIDNAQHNFAGHETELAGCIQKFLATLTF